MGKGIASGHIPPAEITVCDGCFHKDVCGDKDYLTENACSAKAGGCYCRECEHYGPGPFGYGCHMMFDGRADIIPRKPDDFCSYSELRRAQDDG